MLLSLFHSEVSDRIDKTATSYINSGNLRATGVELSAHWRPTDDLGFFGGGTWTAVPLENLLPLVKGGEWYVSVENITNQHYEYYPGYPMAGAMIWTGVKLKF